MKTQLACQPLASRYDPLAELVRALAHDSECAINPGLNTSGVVGAEALQVYHRNRAANHGGSVMLLIQSCYTSNKVKLDIDCEIIWAEVLLKDQRKLHVCSFYQSSGHKHAHLENFKETLMEKVGQ